MSDEATATEPAVEIPEGVGLKAGRSEPESGRSGRDLVDAAAGGASLNPREHDDLVQYFLSNEELPGDSDVQPLEVTLGHNDRKRTFRCEVHPIKWEERQDAVERATNSKTGRFDPYTSASWIVARALVKPQLGPTIARLQAEDADKAPEDAADLLRRMFRKQSGALLSLSGKVLEISHLQDGDEPVREIDAAKN